MRKGVQYLPASFESEDIAVNVSDIENCRYAFQKDFIPKRIGDMDRAELIQVITELAAAVKWWTDATLHRSSWL